MQKIREQIGSAGLIVAIVALIAALGGGAYAASSSGGGKQASASASSKGPRGPRGKPGKPGKPGATGATGATGAIGPAGPAGPVGGTGKEGPAGKEGLQGAPGEGVAVTPATLANCGGRGGILVKKGSEAAKEVCNGEKGAEGPIGKEGPPLIPGSTLSTGETLTGGWAFTATAADTGGVYTAISFPVSLSGGLGEEEVHYVTRAEQDNSTQPAGCAGGTMNAPVAQPGQLCVYESNAGEVINATFGGIFTLTNNGSEGTNRTGAVLHFNVSGVAHGSGSWAVTNP
jgi:hypothetical protein